MRCVTVSFVIIAYVCINNHLTRCSELPRRWHFQISFQDEGTSNKQYISSSNSTNLQQRVVATVTAPAIPDFVNRAPLPLLPLGGKYYYVVDFFQANFHRAYQFCKEHSMNLLSIENQAENDLIATYMATNNLVTIWTSATNLAGTGKYVWFSTAKSLSFTSWGPNQPDNAGGDEHCVEIVYWTPEKKYVWNDNSCNATKHFICEVKKCTDFCVND